MEPDQNREADGSGGQPLSSRNEAPRRPTLNASVRRRRADRAFYMRLAGAMRQNERALERLRR